MSGWVERRIGEFFNYTVPGDWGTEPTSANTVPVIRSTNMQNDGRLNLERIVYRNVSSKSLALRVVNKGDILIEKSGGGPQQPAGRVAYCDTQFGGTCSNFVEVAKVNSEFDPHFVFFKLYSLYQTGLVLKYQQQTTGIINFKLNEFKLELVSVPSSKGEQARIAKVLAAVDHAIAQTENLIAKYRRVKTGLMHDLLTRGVDGDGQLRDPAQWKGSSRTISFLYPHWDVKPLCQVATIASGVTLGRDVSGPDAVTLPYLRVFNVQDGYVDLSDMKTVTIRKTEIARFKLEKGDVLMNEGGDFDKLGRGAVWKGQIEPCLHQNHVFRVRTDNSQLLPDFLALVSASPYGRRFFVLNSKQSTNLASINSTQLKAFPIPCPGVEEQHRILNILAAHEDVLNNEQARLTKLNRVKRGLMQDLLTGRVPIAPLLDNVNIADATLPIVSANAVPDVENSV